MTLVAKEPAHPNLIARIKGDGSKKSLLIMGQRDTVKVDLSKWSFPPFSATRNGGFVYGRGTLDDKSNLYAAMMTTVLLEAHQREARPRRHLCFRSRRRR